MLGCLNVKPYLKTDFKTFFNADGRDQMEAFMELFREGFSLLLISMLAYGK